MRSMKPFRRLSVQLFDLLHHAVSRSSEIERDSVRFAVDVHFPRIWRFHIIRRRKRRDLARRLLAGVLFFFFFVVDVLLLLLFVPEVALGRGGRAQHASRRVHVDGTFDAPDPDCMSQAIFWGKKKKKNTFSWSSTTKDFRKTTEEDSSPKVVVVVLPSEPSPSSRNNSGGGTRGGDACCAWKRIRD